MVSLRNDHDCDTSNARVGRWTQLRLSRRSKVRDILPRNAPAYEDHVVDWSWLIAYLFLSERARARSDIIRAVKSMGERCFVSFFSEFYRSMVNHLEDDGILAQWLQLYELEPRLVASVFKALEEVFSDYGVCNRQGTFSFWQRKRQCARTDGGGVWSDALRGVLARFGLSLDFP